MDAQRSSHEMLKTEPYEAEIPRVHQGDLNMLADTEVRTLAQVAKALSDPIRLHMIQLLGQREDLCTCEFEELLSLSQSKVSYHCHVLLNAGIIVREAHGTWSHYRLRLRALDQLRAMSEAARWQATVASK